MTMLSAKTETLVSSSSPSRGDDSHASPSNDTKPASQKVGKNVLISLGAGAIAGSVAKTTIAPLDRTKIYFQTHPHKNYRIKGAYKFLKLTYERTGFFSLWRGNSATMARIVPYAAIQFMSHEQYKVLFGLNDKSRKTPHIYHFVAGSSAGVTAQCMTYPLDRARAVMAVTPMGEYKNLKDVFRRIISEEGFWALYRGFTPTILGVIPYAGTSFFIYETLKKFWIEKAQKNGESHGITTVQRLCSGAIAGLMGQTTSYPLDIVRRRMQTSSQIGVTYTSIISTLSKEGIRRGWFKGLSMNFIKGPIATGISFTVYEQFRALFTTIF